MQSLGPDLGNPLLTETDESLMELSDFFLDDDIVLSTVSNHITHGVSENLFCEWDGFASVEIDTRSSWAWWGLNPRLDPLTRCVFEHLSTHVQKHTAAYPARLRFTMCIERDALFLFQLVNRTKYESTYACAQVFVASRQDRLQQMKRACKQVLARELDSLHKLNCPLLHPIFVIIQPE